LKISGDEQHDYAIDRAFYDRSAKINCSTNASNYVFRRREMASAISLGVVLGDQSSDFSVSTDIQQPARLAHPDFGG